MFDQNEIEYLQSVLLTEETTDAQLSEEENIFLDGFFEAILQATAPTINTSLAIELYNHLKNNEFTAPLEIVEKHPECIDEITKNVNYSQLSNFLLLLLKHDLFVIAEKIWIRNTKFAIYFSGILYEPNLKQTNSKDFMSQQIDIEELINNFKMVAKSQSKLILEYMWSNSTQIKNFYTLKPTIREIFNFNQKIIPLLLMADFYESIELFNCAINLKSPNIINELWNNNQFISDYYCGKDVVVKSVDQELTLKIGVTELNFILKKLMSLKLNKIVVRIWQDNQIFAEYLSGDKFPSKNSTKSVQVYETGAQSYLIDINEIFKIAIANKFDYIYNYIWKNNQSFVSYFTGMQLSFLRPDIDKNFYIEEEREKIKILIDNFKFLLEFDAQFAIVPMLKANKFLEKYVTGIPQSIVNHESTGVKYWAIIHVDFLELVYYFKKLLSFNMQAICSEIIKYNSCLKDYILGEEIEISSRQVNGKVEKQKFKISDEGIINFFELLFVNSFNNFSSKMWQKNNLLLSKYYSGEPIEVNSINTNNIVETKTLQLNVLKLAQLHSSMISNQLHDIARDIWTINKEFYALSCGYSVKYQDNTTKKTGYLKYNTLQLYTLFVNFVENKYDYIIIDLLKHNPIKDMLNNLSSVQLKHLTEKILDTYIGSKENSESAWILDFMVNHVTLDLLNEMYNEKALQTKPSKCNNYQLKLLSDAQLKKINVQVSTARYISEFNIFESSNKKRKKPLESDLNNDQNEAAIESSSGKRFG